MKRKNIPTIIVFFALIILIIIYFYAQKLVETKVDFHKGNYIGSKECKDCHEERYKSWKKTYHKTMTQEANNSTVVGNFDGSQQTYWGITISPIEIDNRYYFVYSNPETKEKIYTLEIKRTVGSRRYQQYLAQTDNTQGNYYRLELLWHIEDKRWIHLNGAFLGSDQQSFDNHTTIWNQNCIFCHNTGIQPNMTNYDEIIQSTKQGKRLNLKVDSLFESQVTDLGIACEACHANGEKHIKLNQNPLRKYYLHYTNNDDISIINPSKLSAKKSMDVCGQCHGQRTPKTFELAKQWMHQGPSYRPGDNLLDHVNPVWKNSMLNTKSSDIFKQRFWKDSTPRLTAYEYQGILQSQCHIQGELTCNDCHSMHEGNPKGMIKEDKLTNQACFKCHADYENNLSQHTAHNINSEGSLCYNCHMPKITYGIMTLHRSHKIESPNPVQEFSHDKPNACVACHIDKSSDWIMKKSLTIWPQLTEEKQITTKKTIQSLLSLHSGDPVERAVAAVNISYQGNLHNSQEKIFFIPHLLYSMGENYPAIRRFSYKSLMSIIKQLSYESTSFEPIQNVLLSFDFIEELEARTKKLDLAWAAYNSLDKSTWAKPPQGSLLNHDYKLDIKTLIQLRNISLQENKLIDIGE
jgi:predicted CXXCH cytochrome family protein